VRIRLLLSGTLAAALALSVSGAEAATPTMDGKKVKLLRVSATSGVEEHDVDLVASSGEPVECGKPRCVRLPFVYKPAAGVKGGLLFTATWKTPGTDVDLFVGEVDKRGGTTEIASCASSGPPSEKVYLAPSQLRSGRTYVMVLDFFRAVNEKVEGKVEINVPNSVKTTVPAKVDDLKKVNCTL
jgi:hypothetical protein